MPETNILSLSGQVTEIEKSHSYLNEEFYRFTLKVLRLSGNYDLLPVIVSEKLLYNNEVEIGDFVTIDSQLRTKNHRSNNRKKLLVFGYALDVIKITEDELNNIEDKNQLTLTGFVVKKPVYRETKKGRKITELLIASNRQYNKSDYLPSIAWGVDAVYSSKFKIGEKVSVKGRFQSRNYITRDSEGNPTEGTTYEVSIAGIEVNEDKE